MMARTFAVLFGAGVLFATGVASADDRAEYNRRAADRMGALFQSLDRDRNGALTRIEAHGDLDLGPRFDDMDIDRNGIVTVAELQRYVGQQFGVELKTAQK